MEGPSPGQETMLTDMEPSNTVKLLHLVFLSTSWGMQIWVTFVAGRLRSGLTAVALCPGGGPGEGALPQDLPALPPCRVRDGQPPPSPHLWLHPA